MSEPGTTPPVGPVGPVGQGPVGQGPVGQGPVGQGPVGQGPVGQGPAGQGPATSAELPPVGQPPGPGGRTTVWKVGVPVTAALSACFAVVTFLGVFLSAFCGDGGTAGLPACLTAFWGLVGCTGLTMLIPLIFGIWGYRAVDNRQAGRRLAICASGYLLPVGWFLGLLRFYFH